MTMMMVVLVCCSHRQRRHWRSCRKSAFVIIA